MQPQFTNQLGNLLPHFIGTLCWHKLLQGRAPVNVTHCPSTNTGLAWKPQKCFQNELQNTERLLPPTRSSLMDLHSGHGGLSISSWSQGMLKAARNCF